MVAEQDRTFYPWDVSFERVPIMALGSHGTPYIRWVPIGMPKLGRYTPILKAVFFLYPDAASALSGVKSGGTGFLVGVPMTRFAGYCHVHAIINYHVAAFNKDAQPSPVIRINRKSGGAEAFEFDPSEWVFKPGFSDIAVSPPLNLSNEHDYMMLDLGWFMTKEEEVADEIGPGDDVFMIGRFVDYDGVETNVPAARFGHISMMAANVEQSTGYKGRSIILDMHSRSGFSGSPVIIYRTIGSHFMETPKHQGSVLTGGGHYIKLLGIHYAQFPEAWELREKKNQSPVSQAALKADSHYIDGLSGMTCVVPAADILTLINHPDLAAMREKRELLLQTTVAPSVGPKLEAASKSALPATDDNPTHREDFMRLLGAAARKREQED